PVEQCSPASDLQLPFIRAAFSKVSVPRADNKHVASHFEPSVLRQRAKREIDGFGAELSQEMPTADRRRSDPMSWRPFRTDWVFKILTVNHRVARRQAP